MATAEELNYLRDQAYRNNPPHSDDPYSPAYSPVDDDAAPGRGDWEAPSPHGDPDPTIRIRRYFAEGDIEQGLAMLASMLNLKGAAASDGAQGLIDTFGIPMTVEQLRAHQGLNPDGTEIASEDDGLPPAEDIENTLPEDEPPSGGERIIASDLANDDALRDMILKNDRGELNLSITGILGAIFGANLTEALNDDALINQALGLFGLSRDQWNEDPGRASDDDESSGDEPSGDEPSGDEPSGDQPSGDQPPGDQPPGDQPPGDQPPGNGNGGLPPPGGINNDPPLNPEERTIPGDDESNDDDDEDNGMPDWLEDILRALLGDRRDMPGGGTGTGVGIGMGGAGGEAEAKATSGDVSSDIKIGDTEATGGAGGEATGGAGGEATGGEATGGEASNILGDVLSTIANTYISEAPDYSVQGYLAQKYASDAAKDAKEKELEFLRELMGRQDTFQLFRNLGLPIKDAEGNIIEDNERVDFQINQLRDLVNRDLEDRYKIQPEIDVKPLIQEVTTIDPGDINQINVAELLMGLDPGAAPGAIDTLVNQIDPFNPEDPALRFLQDEAMRAIESTAAAQGRLNTGGTLQELQNQAIGTAAQYAGDVADIGRLQDTSQLAADQQFYTQLFGTGQEDFGRGMERYGMVADAQTAADDMFLEGELARFGSEQKNLAQQYDMSRFANTDALARETQLYNEMAPLVDIGLAGAEGLTGNTADFASQGLPIYRQLGEISSGTDLNKKLRNTDLVRDGYNILKKTLGF